MKLTIITIAFCSMLVGCAAPRAPLNTASGNPEIVIEGVTKKQIEDHIVDRLTAKGFTIRSVNEYKIVAGKRLDQSLAAQLLFGSRYDSVPEARVSYTLIDHAPGVKVYGRAEIVTNPGSGFERVQDVTRGENAEIQDMLSKLRMDLEPQSAVEAAPAGASPTVAVTPAFKDGQDKIQAENFAKTHACLLPVTAGPSGPGFEMYSANCTNGDTLMIRCEFGNCRALK